MKQQSFIVGVAARQSEKTGIWYADLYTLEEQPDGSEVGLLGGRLRVGAGLASVLRDTFRKNGVGWYHVGTASLYMGQQLVSQATTLEWIKEQPVSPLASLGSPRGAGGK